MSDDKDTARPQVGDRVVIENDSERFESDVSIRYFEEELRQRGVDTELRWCNGAVTGERGSVVAVFAHMKRSDHALVVVVNVDGRGLIAISSRGVALKMYCGLRVQLLPRLSLEMKAWRASGRLAFINATTVPVEDVSRCVGVTEACVPHPQRRGQFVWLVLLDDAENVFTIAHAIDMVQFDPSRQQKRCRPPRQLLTMVPSTSSRGGSSNFEFRGAGSKAIRTAVEADDECVLRLVQQVQETDESFYLHKYFSATSDEGLFYQ